MTPASAAPRRVFINALDRGVPARLAGRTVEVIKENRTTYVVRFSGHEYRVPKSCVEPA